MPILYDNYLIVPHKDLHSVFDASAKKKPVAMRHALDLAKKTNKVIVIVRVIEIITPQQAAEHSVNQTAGSLQKNRGLAWQWCSQAPAAGYASR